MMKSSHQCVFACIYQLFLTILHYILNVSFHLHTHIYAYAQQYFPTDAEAWQKAVKDYTWWIWLCSRLIGAYDMRTATKTALWLFCVLWYVWPVRYFFYYRYISCTPTEAMTGCIHSVGVSNTCNTNMEQLFETNNVFYINMLCQGALLMMCCNIAYLLTMLKALNMPHSASRDAKKNQDSTYKTGTCSGTLMYAFL